MSKPRGGSRQWVDRARSFVGGAGPGLGATRYTEQARDVAAYEATAASRPKCPPGKGIVNGARSGVYPHATKGRP
jgi:hypothetical protein